MTNETLEMKWKVFSGKIDRWWNKRIDEHSIRINAKREQSIGILQKRYGYTREKAASEFKKHYSNAILD
jgi:uncharacterized protein YjbJ (UPF0337 family)